MSQAMSQAMLPELTSAKLSQASRSSCTTRRLQSPFRATSRPSLLTVHVQQYGDGKVSQSTSQTAAALSRRQAIVAGAVGGIVSNSLGDLDQPQGASAEELPAEASIETAAAPLQQAADTAATVVSSEVSGLSNAMDRIELGRSGMMVTPIGIGAWSWGDRSGYWGYGEGYQKEDNEEAFRGMVESGIGLIDTAEVYGFGLSEEFVGDFMRNSGSAPIIATKYAPLPWRFTAGSVVGACKASLARLGIDQMGLYQIHWPGFITNSFVNDNFVQGLADCKNQGLTQAVGVSNFKPERVRSASRILQADGVPLASNQIQYSLLYRVPETNGVIEACNEVGATVIAYSPLAQGLLTGKYTADNLPTGPRAFTINADRVAQIEPLIRLMRDIGAAHGGKTPGQVAINWTICKGALPIPGAKNARQAREAAGAFGWRLNEDEVAALDAASDKIPSITGAPFENW